MIPLEDRIRGMIWGQFVGDAATLGTHWIYDLDELGRAFPEGVQGFEEPRQKHFHFGKMPGDLTHYGDAALLLLESVAERRGFDAADFAERFTGFFGAPDCRSYRDHATRETLVHLAAKPGDFRNGANDDQPATVTRLAPVAALHGDDAATSEELTRFAQNNDRAVSYARAHGQILAALLRGESFEVALDGVSDPEPLEKIAAARAARNKSVVDATLAFGQGCPLAKSFPAAVHAALTLEHDLPAAIRETARAGGDSAARAAMIGAWLGATGGLAAVPSAWRDRLRDRERIAVSIERLMEHIGSRPA